MSLRFDSSVGKRFWSGPSSEENLKLMEVWSLGNSFI